MIFIYDQSGVIYQYGFSESMCTFTVEDHPDWIFFFADLTTKRY